MEEGCFVLFFPFSQLADWSQAALGERSNAKVSTFCPTVRAPVSAQAHQREWTCG